MFSDGQFSAIIAPMIKKNRLLIGAIIIALFFIPYGLIMAQAKNPTHQTNAPHSAGNAQEATETPLVIQMIITNTPNKAGVVTHTVKAGETLWQIAISYGVKIDDILTNSGLALGTTAVYENQVLVIKTESPVTDTPTPTETPIQPTATNTPLRPTRTPFPTRTPAPTATATPKAPITYQVFGNSKNVGIVLVSICSLGLAAVIIFGFVIKQKPMK